MVKVTEITDEGEGTGVQKTERVDPMSAPTTVAAFPIVDAHQHFWDLERNYHPWLRDEPPVPFRYGDYSAIRKSYLPEQYASDTRGIDIVKTVHVEAEWDPRDPVGETRWLEQVAKTNGLPTACVAQAWLDRDDVDEVLAGQAARPLVRSIRHKPQAATVPAEARRGASGSMDDPCWRRGFALLEGHGLSFDLQTPYWHFDAATELARDFPNTPIIINHTGLPVDRSEAGLASWRAAMHAVAQCGNVCVKISGLGIRGVPWTVASNGPVVRDTIAIFGAERCMFASNFPVDGLCASFATIFEGFRAIVAHMPNAVQRMLFHDNAVRIYRL